MDDVAFLPVAGELIVDELGRPSVSTDSWRQVLVNFSTLGFEEQQRAAQNDLTATWRLKVFWLDYEQEDFIKFRGKVYKIYRSYLNANEEKYELYLANRINPTEVGA